MPWPLVSLGHKQPRYWLCGVRGFFSYMKKNINYLHHLSFEKSNQYKFIIINSAQQYNLVCIGIKCWPCSIPFLPGPQSGVPRGWVCTKSSGPATGIPTNSWPPGCHRGWHGLWRFWILHVSADNYYSWWIGGKNNSRTANIRRTSVCNKIVDHSDVVGASPVSTAPITSSFSTKHLASMDWTKTTARRDEKRFSCGIWCGLYWSFDSNYPVHAWLTMNCSKLTPLMLEMEYSGFGSQYHAC